MDAPTEKLPMRESRYVVQDDQPLLVTVRRQQNDEELSAQVANLSLGGAKLLLAKPLNFTEEIQVTMALPEHELTFNVPARICWWARPSGQDQWSVGCAFSQRLTTDLLNSLSGLGYLERRTHSRLEVDFPAFAKWELSDSNAPVQIRNYSTGGFVMISRQRAQADQQLMLEIPTDNHVLTLTARVVWQARLDDTYRIGCSFVGKRDAETMRQAATFFHGPQDEVEETPAPSYSPSRSILLTAVAAGVLAWMTQWLRPEAAPKHVGTREVAHMTAVTATDHVSVEPTVVTDPAPAAGIDPSVAPQPAELADLPADSGGHHVSPSEPATTANSLQLDERARDSLQLASTGQIRDALTQLGELIKQAPRDPAYRYTMAAIAHAAGFKDFAKVQLGLGWTLEQRYQTADPLRLTGSLSLDQRTWLEESRSLLLHATPATDNRP